MKVTPHKKSKGRKKIADKDIFVSDMPPDVPEDQKYFWTKEFQKKLKQAKKEVEEGKTLGPFDNFEDICKALKI
jgi:hypothetical protein